MCGNELKFLMGLFISIMKADREGGQEADAAVRPCVLRTTCLLFLRTSSSLTGCIFILHPIFFPGGVIHMPGTKY